MLAVGLLAFLPARLAAATPLLNVDFCAHLNWSFSNKVGPAAVGQGPNDFWNLYSRDDGAGGFLSSGSVIDLKWADGTTSPADLTVANAPGMWPSGSADPMMQSYLYPSGGSDMTVTLTDVPAGTYDLYFYAHGEPGGENGVVQVASAGIDYGTKSTTTSPGWNTTDWVEGQQYVRFQNVEVSDQPLVITVKPGSTGLAVMNGMQLLQKPPPTVLPLLNVDFCAHLNWSFTNKVGPAAVGQGPNDFWNLYSRDDGSGGFLPSGSVIDLKWADGTVSSVDLAVANAPGMWPSGSADPMMQSYLYPFGASEMTVTLADVPAGTYDLYFYAHGEPGGENGVVQVASAGIDYGTKSTTTSPGWNTTGWVEGQQYVRFQNVEVSEQPLVITVKPGSTGLAVMNGLQLLAVSATPPPPPPTPTPLARWRFEETSGAVAHDSAGVFPGNLSPTGASFVEGGIAGRGLYLDRSAGGFVNMGNVLGMETGDFSLVAWLKMNPGDTTESYVPVSKHIGGYANGYGLFANHSTAWGSTGRAWFYDSASIWGTEVVSTTVVNDGSWHQVVGVYEAGGSKHIYVDGAPAEASGSAVPIVSNGGDFLLGGFNQNGMPTAAFTGWLDEVQVYGRALSAAEVDYLFRNPGNPPPPPPFNLATNGSFELPPGILTYRVFNTGTDLPGWIVEQGTVEIVGPYWQAAEGVQSLDLNGIFEDIGTISHPLSTMPGQRYKVRFAYAGNPEGGPAIKTTKVFWNDTLLAEVSFDTTGRSLTDMGWVYYEYEVTAASTSSLLKFQSTTPSFCGPALDDVSVTILDGPPPPPSVVADWTFEEGTPGANATSVVDVSGGGHPGSIFYGNPTFAVSPPSAQGRGNVSLALGSSSGFRPEDSPAFNFGDAFTLEALVMPGDNNEGAWGRLIVSGFNPATGAIIFGLGYRGDIHSAVLGDITAPIPQDGASHHLAAVYSRPTLAMYLDGQLAGTMTYEYPFPPAGEPSRISIGCDYLGGFWFGGLIDRVRVSNRALSPTEFFAAPVPPAFNDGIPDSWREQHFGSGFATDPRAAATADPDGDGANNYREFLDGTDPLNASSVKGVPLWVSTYAGSTRGAQDGFRTEARFNELYGMARDPAGRLWLPETRGIGWDQPGDGFHRIRLLDTQGMVSVLTGAEAGLVEGPLDQARFSGPFGVVFDSAGNAFVLDLFNHRIRKIDASGVVSTFAGSTRGYHDGPALEAQFDLPHGIAIDAQDNLFIADWFNLRIRKITPQGEVSTFSGSTRGAQDGPRLEATYDSPVDVIVSPGGVMYVSDWANGRIRKMDANGDVTTFAAGLPYTETLSLASDGGVYCYVAGLRQLNRYTPGGELTWSWAAPEGSEDGPIGVARFGGRLTKVIELADGNLLVGDDARIRLITMGVVPLLTIAPLGGTFTDRIEVTLSTVVPSGVIRFTTDGSGPTTASPAYATPVGLTASTTLRARVFVNGTPVSDIANAEFTRVAGDEQPPQVTITSPAPGPTDNELVQLLGIVSDNVGVVSARWEWDGQPQGPLALNDGQFLVPGLRLHAGENRFRVVATDAAGNEGSAEVLVSWAPARVLFVENPEDRQEGQKVRVPVKLTSSGGVGGLTFVLRYNAEYLRPLSFEWFTESDSAYRLVNLDVPGEIRATLALTDTAMPAGTHRVGTMVFRARSVPASLTTELPLELVDISDTRGDRIGFGNAARSGAARILVRRVVGDNNANQRLDTGDATAIQRFLTALDPVRDWDRSGNDVNQNTQLDSGDVVRILRAVVGLDPQPTPVKAGTGEGSKEDVLTVGTTALSADLLRGQPGDRITVQVRVQDVPVPVSGAAFTLEYPTNALRLLDRQSHRVGPLAAGRALAMWNVAPPQNDYRTQPGRVSLGLSGASAWPESNGVLAEFTFEVQPGHTARYAWPVRLRGVEIASANGLELFRLPDAELRFIGRDPVRPNLEPPSLTASGDGIQLRLTGEADVPYVVEASSDLRNWTAVGTVQSPEGLLNFTEAVNAAAGQRFYRLRQQ
jgi:choice-of-anchor C domain-containing protein